MDERRAFDIGFCVVDEYKAIMVIDRKAKFDEQRLAEGGLQRDETEVFIRIAFNDEADGVIAQITNAVEQYQRAIKSRRIVGDQRVAFHGHSCWNQDRKSRQGNW